MILKLQSVLAGILTNVITIFVDGNVDKEDDFEECVLRCLLDAVVHLPVDSKQFLTTVNKYSDAVTSHERIVDMFQKFAVQQLIRS